MTIAARCSPVAKRIADAFEQEGADASYMDGARERFLGSRVNEDATREQALVHWSGDERNLATLSD
jgi:hypothetical protein